MNLSRFVVWLVAIVWFAWAAAIDTQARTSLEAPFWLPDVGVALFVAWAVRIELRHLMMLAFLAALARTSFSVEPPVAVFAAHIAVALLVGRGRQSFDLSRPLARAFVAAIVTSLWMSWSWVVLLARHGEGTAPTWGTLFAAALWTGLLTLFFGGWMARLPGVGALGARRIVQ
jgi:hypothetical protein